MGIFVRAPAHHIAFNPLSGSSHTVQALESVWPTFTPQNVDDVDGYASVSLNQDYIENPFTPPTGYNRAAFTVASKNHGMFNGYVGLNVFDKADGQDIGYSLNYGSGNVYPLGRSNLVSYINVTQGITYPSFPKGDHDWTICLNFAWLPRAKINGQCIIADIIRTTGVGTPCDFQLNWGVFLNSLDPNNQKIVFITSDYDGTSKQTLEIPVTFGNYNHTGVVYNDSTYQFQRVLQPGSGSDYEDYNNSYKAYSWLNPKWHVLLLRYRASDRSISVRIDDGTDHSFIVSSNNMWLNSVVNGIYDTPANAVGLFIGGLPITPIDPGTNSYNLGYQHYGADFDGTQNNAPYQSSYDAGGVMTTNYGAKFCNYKCFDLYLSSYSLWNARLSDAESANLWNNGSGIDYPFNTIALSNTINYTDSTEVHSLIRQSSSQIITFTDNVGFLGTMHVGSTVLFTDSVSYQLPLSENIVDVISFTDQVQTNQFVFEDVNQTVTFTDTVHTNIICVSVVDTIVFSDKSNSSNKSVVATDNITFSQVLDYQVLGTSNIIDVVHFTDSVTSNIKQFDLIDTITYSDSLLKAGPKYQTFIDRVKFTDTVIINSNRQFDLLQCISFGDKASPTILKTISSTLTLTQDVALNVVKPLRDRIYFTDIVSIEGLEENPCNTEFVRLLSPAVKSTILFTDAVGIVGAANYVVEDNILFRDRVNGILINTKGYSPFISGADPVDLYLDTEAGEHLETEAGDPLEKE